MPPCLMVLGRTTPVSTCFALTIRNPSKPRRIAGTWLFANRFGEITATRCETLGLEQWNNPHDTPELLEQHACGEQDSGAAHTWSPSSG